MGGQLDICHPNLKIRGIDPLPSLTGSTPLAKTLNTTG